MPTSTGGAAAARATVADDDAVLLRIAADLRTAKSEAADAAESFAALCRNGSAPPQLARAAASAYLAAGRFLALANRLTASR